MSEIKQTNFCTLGKKGTCWQKSLIYFNTQIRLVITNLNVPRVRGLHVSSYHVPVICFNVWHMYVFNKYLKNPRMNISFKQNKAF